ncbi:MFS transporter [Falsiroseomonas oryziterrae]|uniref:MFS transporter n=1 Tax=Falsiroseomonas oryziterrae TaxID=2911368 RepID=UPI001F4024C3|nr:MFS transporter [Roseomonas sp. NPKOSM-4]
MTPASHHALVYATQFFAFGVILPFLPAVLAAQGLDAAEVGIVLATGSALRLLAGPMGGRLADTLAAPRAVLALAAATAALCCGGFLVAAGFLAMLLTYALMSVALAPVMPLTDALTLAAIRRTPFDYGRVRAAGSVAFIVASLLAGQAVAWAGPAAALPLIMAGLAATALAAVSLPAPEASRGRSTASGAAGLLAPLKVPALRWLILVSALVQGSHAFYYAFGTLHWQAAGLGAGLIGALWSVGVIAEIALFVWGRGIVARLGAVRLSLIAAMAGVLRWAFIAVTTDPIALFALQILHAGTFGAQHLAAMMILARVVPPAQAGTAQALQASLGGGLSIGVLTLAAGPLYAAFGGGGYWVMAALCAAAVPAILALGRALRH